MSIHIPQLNIDEALRYMGCPPEQEIGRAHV